MLYSAVLYFASIALVAEIIGGMGASWSPNLRDGNGKYRTDTIQYANVFLVHGGKQKGGAKGSENVTFHDSLTFTKRVAVEVVVREML